jgi:hypothetical protein
VRTYGKFIAQVVGAFLTFLLPALVAGDGKVDTSEWVNVGILGFGSLMVLNGGELPDRVSAVWSKAKFFISALLAGLVVFQSALSDASGITTGEWWQVAIAVLTALGVLAAPGPKVLPDTPTHQAKRAHGGPAL